MPGSQPESRYRRRVLGVGAVAAFALYVVGAPIYNNRIENDLERRVPAALAAAGHGTIDAKFSGQEGTLTCGGVLDDPERALAAAHAVHGVQSIELDRACRVNTASGGDGNAGQGAGTVAPGDPAPASTGLSDDAVTDDTGTTLPDFATLGAVLAEDAQFSSIALLADGSDLEARFADPAAGPYTMFAPTNDAFDALPSAAAGMLASDPELRAGVVRSHVVEGAVTADELAALDGNTLTTLAGTELAIALDGGVVTVAGAAVGDAPINTANGVVYALDEVLPDGLAEVTATSRTVATLAEGMLTLTGTVADAAARDVLVLAGTRAVGAERFEQQLSVDADGGLDAGTAAELGELIGTLAAELVSGEAGYDGNALFLTGIYPDDAAAARAQAAATALGAATDLAPRPAATADQAAQLETELNDFVRANPIQFQPNSAVLDQSAIAIVDRIAARLAQFGGLSIAVQGHTDSDGSAATNRALSERRAAAVRQALVDRGIDPAAISSEGFGAEQPVIENGLENKSASRRVEFRIAAG